MRWEGTIETGRPVEDDEETTLLPSTTRPSTWVPNLPSKRQVAPVAYPMIDGIVSQHSDGRALEAQPSIVETATPFWRALAQVIRTLAPALIITGLVMLAALIVGADEWTAAGILILGAVLVAVFWVYTDKLERRDSAAGVEHHKIDEAADIARLRERNQHKLKKALVKDYIRSLNHDSPDD
jgi:hypothetical protein